MRVIEEIPFVGRLYEDELGGWPIVCFDDGVMIKAYLSNNLARGLGYRHKWELINETIGQEQYEVYGCPRWVELCKRHIVWHNKIYIDG